MRFDNGPAVEYRFDEIQSLRWRHQGETMWREQRYESWESAPGVVMFGHLMDGAPDIGPNCTLVEMARLQGDGVIRRAESRVLATTCVKQDGIWKIARAELSS